MAYSRRRKVKQFRQRLSHAPTFARPTVILLSLPRLPKVSTTRLESCCLVFDLGVSLALLVNCELHRLIERKNKHSQQQGVGARTFQKETPTIRSTSTTAILLLVSIAINPYADWHLRCCRTVCARVEDVSSICEESEDVRVIEWYEMNNEIAE